MDIEQDILSEEAFNELIDNFEIVKTLTAYGRKGIKENVRKMQKRINELEEENHIQRSQIMTVYDNGWIPKQKVKNFLDEINREYNKLDKEIDKQIKDENKDYFECKEKMAVMQTLAYCRDNLEELLKEK